MRLGPGRLLGALAALGLAWTAPLGAETLAASPVPAWVEAQTFVPPAVVTPGPTGLDYLWSDTQVNTATGDEYRHLAYRIRSGGGLKEGALVGIDLDPGYRTLRFHRVTLWHGGEARALTPDFQRLRREPRLEEQLYDGRETWSALLVGPQVGDVVELAWTLAGSNPVFGGVFADIQVLTARTQPAAAWRLRYFTPAPAPGPTVRVLESTLQAGPVPVAGGTATEFRSAAAPALQLPSQFPDTLNPVPRAVVSSWKDWGQVARWAASQFDTAPTPALKAWAQGLTQGVEGDEARARALLTWVQDSVRYFGIESGPSSHRPRAPEAVFTSRFGDCKDKAVLFCALARAQGLDAVPLLVSTRGGEALPAGGPTPLAFNHAVALVRIGPDAWVVDPTADHQSGPLALRSRLDFRYGLAVEPGTTDLLAVAPPPAEVETVVRRVVYPSWKADAQIEVEAQFVGSVADTQRRWAADLGTSEWKESMARNLEPEAKILEGPAWTDDPATGRATLKFAYSAASPWKLASGRWSASYFPRDLSWRLWGLDPDHVGDPRALALDLGPRGTYEVTEVVTLPAEFNLKASDQTVEGPGFRLATQVKSPDTRTIVYHHVYEALSDRVEASDRQAMAEKLGQARTAVSWTLSHSSAEPVPPTLVGTLTALFTGGLLFWIVAAAQGAAF